MSVYPYASDFYQDSFLGNTNTASSSAPADYTCSIPAQRVICTNIVQPALEELIEAFKTLDTLRTPEIRQCPSTKGSSHHVWCPSYDKEDCECDTLRDSENSFP